MKPDLGHCSVEGDYSTSCPRLRVADGGRLVQLRFARSHAAEWNAEMFGSNFGGVRGVCRGFSFGSRRRMMSRLNSVSVAAPLPAFVTLTFPDACFDDNTSTFAKFAKLCLDTWLKRLKRVAPTACGFWRLEWKARKSGAHEGKLFPHFHLMVWGMESRPVPGNIEKLQHFVRVENKQLQFELLNHMEKFIEHTGRRAGSDEAPANGAWVTAINWGDGRVVEKCCVKQSYVRRVEYQEITCSGKFPQAGFEPECMSLQDWTSLAWYHVVASGDLDHFTAGARVERVRTWGGVVSYCAKYMAKADSEFLGEIPFGRSWGIFNRAAVPWAKIVELDLDEEVGVRLRRVARRYLEHKLGRKWKCPYGITLFCDGATFLRLIPPESPPF